MSLNTGYNALLACAVQVVTWQATFLCWARAQTDTVCMQHTKYCSKQLLMKAKSPDLSLFAIWLVEVPKVFGHHLPLPHRLALAL